jgi:hypothetical protein
MNVFISDFIFALGIALIFSGIIASTGRKGPGPASGFLFFLLMFLLITWAGGIWLTPIGPNLWGVQWVNFLAISLVVFLILGALIPTKPFNIHPPTPEKSQTVAPEEIGFVAAVGFFFWFLALVMIAAILIYYL